MRNWVAIKEPFNLLSVIVKISTFPLSTHYVKSVCIQSFSVRTFPHSYWVRRDYFVSRGRLLFLNFLEVKFSFLIISAFHFFSWKFSSSELIEYLTSTKIHKMCQIYLFWYYLLSISEILVSIFVLIFVYDSSYWQLSRWDRVFERMNLHYFALVRRILSSLRFILKKIIYLLKQVIVLLIVSR